MSDTECAQIPVVNPQLSCVGAIDDNFHMISCPTCNGGHVDASNFTFKICPTCVGNGQLVVQG